MHVGLASHLIHEWWFYGNRFIAGKKTEKEISVGVSDYQVNKHKW